MLEGIMPVLDMPKQAHRYLGDYYADIYDKLAMVKAVVTDVDGVLTDGCMYWAKEGLLFKKFHTRDVGAVFRLRDSGIKFFVITSANDDITRRRIEMMHPDLSRYGVENKLACTSVILDEWGIDLEDAVYIGDDNIDREIMQAVGVSIAPIDALESIRCIADIICPLEGGKGVLAWIADKILNKDSE